MKRKQSVENNLGKVDRVSQISSKMLKRTIIGVILFATVMVGMVTIIIFLGMVSDVLERF